MRVSARQNGFTLIEVLVTLVIVGLLASLSVLAIGDRPAPTLKREARQLQALLQLAIDEASLSGQNFGLQIDRQSYRLLWRDELEARWLNQVAFESSGVDKPKGIDARLLAEHQLPAGMSLRLQSLQQQGLTRAEQAKLRVWQQRAEASATPQIQFFASGEYSAFELSLKHPALDQPATLRGDGFNRPELEL